MSILSLDAEATWRRWPLIAALAAAGALALAHATERFGGYPPCQLCYVQRWVFWGALILGGAAAAALWSSPNRQRAQAANILLAGVFLTSALVAGYHAGVEWRIFPDPGCAAGGGPLTIDDIRAGLDGARKAVSCADAPFRIAGLSMAGWNALFSLGLAGLCLLAASRLRSTWEGAHASVHG